MILAIDPGNIDSAYCLMDDAYFPHEKAKVSNAQLLDYIKLNAKNIQHIVIEMIASYGMAVGADVFDTCTMIGRLEQLADMLGISSSRVFRMEEKERICHDSRASDANIKRALIDRFAKHDMKRGKGTKKNPDWFYGFADDVWSAFAVGLVYLEKCSEGCA